MAQQACRATDDQKRFLVSYMERHPAFCQREFNSAQGAVHIRQTWERLAMMLNEIENGSRKTVEQWIRYWTDQKKTVKNRAARIRRSLGRGTGGGPPPIAGLLSNYEERVLNCMGGWVRVEGFTQVVDPLEVDPLEFIPPPQPPRQQVNHNKRMRLDVVEPNMDWVMDSASAPTSFLDQDDLTSIPLDFWSPVLPSSSQEPPQLPCTTILEGNIAQPVAAARNFHQQRNLSPVAAPVNNRSASTTILQGNVVSASTANIQQQRFLTPVVRSANLQTAKSAPATFLQRNVIPMSRGNMQQRCFSSPVEEAPVNRQTAQNAFSSIEADKGQKITGLPWSTPPMKNLKQQCFMSPVVGAVDKQSAIRPVSATVNIQKPHSASVTILRGNAVPAPRENIQQQRFLKPVAAPRNNQSTCATIPQANAIPPSTATANVQHQHNLSPVVRSVSKQPSLSASATVLRPVLATVDNQKPHSSSVTILRGNAVPAPMQQQHLLKPVAAPVNYQSASTTILRGNVVPASTATANLQHQHNRSPVVGKQTSFTSSPAILRGNTVQPVVGPRNIQQQEFHSSPVVAQSPATVRGYAQQHFLSPVNIQTTQSASTATGVNTVQKITGPTWSTPLKKNLKSQPVATTTPVKLPPTAGSPSIMIDGVKFLILNRCPLKEVNPNKSLQ